MLKAKELRDQGDEDLKANLESFKNEIFKARSERLDSKSQKTHIIRQRRKEIARILTVMRERETKRAL